MLAHADRPWFLTRYDTGVTPYWALQAEPRVGYRLCVPRGYDPGGTSRHRLLVALHGSMREDHAVPFQSLVGATGAIVLAPMFPGGLAIPGDLDAYKFLRFEGFACDRLLFTMIAEVARKYRLECDGTRFALFGFSGGAQFAHRFLYLYPEHLRAVSLAAPGLITLLDDRLPWWVGTGGMAAAFGARRIDRAAVARVPVQIVVGSADDDPTEIAIREGAHDWMPGVNDAGPTRLDRATALVASLSDAGLTVRQDVVQGAGHDHLALIPAATAFLVAVLSHPFQEASG
ncbi:alpha/beta hydrolase [Elioraea sp.]|uniref:alpha/beta hydrolase n=1 Tax=Elioraea sp. TaxID=2185103 RepID=UPI003F70E563